MITFGDHCGRRFKTKFESVVRIDQGIFDIYHYVVNPNYTSQNDHSKKDWGVYTIESVTC